MKILALDLATKTGWAALVNDGVESGVQMFDVRRGESPGMRFLRFNRWLDTMLETVVPDLVVYEQNFRRGGAATEIAAGFSTRVQEATARRGVEHATVAVGTLKKWATGNGGSKKPAMMARAAELYPNVPILDDNHADALLILAWAEETYAAP